jgi:hypothetical protein
MNRRQQAQLSEKYGKRTASYVARYYPDLSPREVNSEVLAAARGHTVTNPKTEAGGKALALAAIRDPSKYGTPFSHSDRAQIATQKMMSETPEVIEKQMNAAARAKKSGELKIDSERYGSEYRVPAGTVLVIGSLDIPAAEEMVGPTTSRPHTGDLDEVAEYYKDVPASVILYRSGGVWHARVARDTGRK